jgi:cardiolipin synthase A/B
MNTDRSLSGNRIHLLESGADYFPTLLDAINDAEQEVLLETYIFERDATGELFVEALQRAARRGVVVRLMVDGFGARTFVRDTSAELIAAGVEVLVYRREIGMISLGRNRLRRLHRKLAVIDGQIAFVGGINIIDDMDTPHHTPPRVDFAVSIEGPLLVRIHRAMVRLWRLMSWVGFKRRPGPMEWVKPVRKRIGRMRADFLVRDNLSHRRDIETAYLDALAGAQQEIIIANAYFLPGRGFRHALMDAARRGVKVTILLQGRVEYWLIYRASQVLYSELLGAGVRIVEYRKSFLHAKVAVVDEDWATVGSSNIDPFSLLLAREANVIIYSKPFTKKLRKCLEQAIESGGVEMTATQWRRQRLWSRLISWAAYGTVRAAMGLVGYGGRQSV